MNLLNTSQKEYTFPEMLYLWEHNPNLVFVYPTPIKMGFTDFYRIIIIHNRVLCRTLHCFEEGYMEDGQDIIFYQEILSNMLYDKYVILEEGLPRDRIIIN